MVERRRCQRLPLSIPVRVYGRTPEDHPFREVTETKAVNLHGGLLPLAPCVQSGQKVLLVNGYTNEEREARIVYVEGKGQEHNKVAIEFTDARDDFWHVFTPGVELHRSAELQRSPSRQQIGAA